MPVYPTFADADRDVRPESPPEYAPHARAERLIGWGRLVLAFFFFVTNYVERVATTRNLQTTHALLLAYMLYALLVLGASHRSRTQSRRAQIVFHAVDLILFSIFVYLSEGPSSPFFLYFVFSLFCATLRFSWRGILLTGLTAMISYGTLALVVARHDPDFEASRIVVREAYLGVIAALLLYLGVYQERLRSELSALAGWPRGLPASFDDLLRSTMAHASGVLRVNRLFLQWEEDEEPWAYTASWEPHHFEIQRAAPDAAGSEDSARLRNQSLFIRRGVETVLVYDPADSSVAHASADAMTDRLCERFALDTLIAVCLRSATFSIRLVTPAHRASTGDDLALAHVCGHLVLAALEQFFFVQQVRQTASAEERLRLSRELHDGVVQSLGGVGLQLRIIRQQTTGPRDVAERLDHLQEVIERDQRELRSIVRELRPEEVSRERLTFADELKRMRARFALEWNLEIEIEIVDGLLLPPRIAHELSRIVSESLVNAVRHGQASHASVSIKRINELIEIRVADDGCGFAFTGRHDLPALEERGDGPLIVRERVKALGGTLTIESSPSGAALELLIPIVDEGA